MKISAGLPAPPSGKRPSVWLWVIINQLAFPGLGTILSGRRVGYLQAALMLVGFFLAMGFLSWFIACVVRYPSHPEWTEDEFRAQYRPYLWAVYWGFGLCLAAWGWALISSLAMLRRAASRSGKGNRVEGE